MDKRVLITVAISMLILFVWTKWIMPPPPPQKPAPTATAPTPTPPPETTASNNQGPKASPTPAAPPKERGPEVTHAVEQEKLYKAEFTSWGAAPKSWVLSHPQYQQVLERDHKKVVVPINLVRTAPPQLPLTMTFPNSDINVPPDAGWTQLPSSGNQLTYSYDAGSVHLEKRYTFVPNSYQFNVEITIENRGDKPIAEHLQLAMYGHQDPNVKSGGYLGPRVVQTEGECYVAGKLKKADLQGLLKNAIDQTGSVHWFGIDEKYFVAAIALNPGPEAQTCQVDARPDGLIASRVTWPEHRIAPHEKLEIPLVGFFGPKLLSELDAIKVAGVDAHLGDSIAYGWTEAIARPMLAVLKGLHFVVPNWGAAIIVITILLKLLTWWPTTKSMKSMQAMSKLKPEMDKIKEKYGNDKNRMNQEVMELYKKHGVNPLGGCLPMLIQFPIYIALYAMLGNSVELYRSGFIWIHDLTAPDPYFALPIVAGVFMFAQQKLTPKNPDPQQRMMGYVMPVMFAGISLFFPAGLNLYILVNTLLTMVQQLGMNRQQAKSGPGAGKPARA